MKKIFYTLLAITLVFSACKKEELEEIPTPPITVVGNEWIMNKMLITGTMTITDNNGNPFSETQINQEVITNLTPNPLHFKDNGTFTYDTTGTGTWSVYNTQLTLTTENKSKFHEINLLTLNELTITDSSYVDTTYTQGGMNIRHKQAMTGEYNR
jgi:hypothetical protein